VVKTPHDIFLVLFNLPQWFVLMPRRLGKSSHQHVVSSEVKTELAPMQIFVNNPKCDIPILTTASTTALHCLFGAAIRVVETTSTPQLAQPELNKDAQTPTLTSRTAKPLSFRNNDSKTMSTRPRGKTAPAKYKSPTPEREKARDPDADSVISLTPSIGSKHLATWFSGLLGR
jgi:hypothetical protein